MIDFLLDTDTCIYLIKRQPAQALARLQSLDISQVGISTIALSELEYGVSKSSKPEQNKLALAGFVAPLEIIAYDDAAATHYGRIRTLLERQGTPIGPLGHPDRSACVGPRMYPRDEQRQGVLSHSPPRSRELG